MDSTRWRGPALVIGCIAALILVERRRPLRKPVEPGAARIARNVTIAALTAASVSAIERPLVTRCAHFAERNAWGMVPHLPLTPRLRKVAALFLMDYTLYWWHVLLHRVPALWRVHEPHHIDRDLDTTTALRFHFAEFLASIPWRCAQIVTIGVGPRTLMLWQTLTLLEVLFHHSNVRLPRSFERWLARLIVTPRLHGIHHSVVRRERDSNYSSGLSLWDRVHGTSCADLAHDEVRIGLPEFDRPCAVTLGKTLALPFRSLAARNDRRGKHTE